MNLKELLLKIKKAKRSDTIKFIKSRSKLKEKIEEATPWVKPNMRKSKMDLLQ